LFVSTRSDKGGGHRRSVGVVSQNRETHGTS
jgi:hypothetical protein